MEEWRRVQDTRPPTLKSLLLRDEGGFDIGIPPRGQFANCLPKALQAPGVPA
jgi:hypothetical protein